MAPEPAAAATATATPSPIHRAPFWSAYGFPTASEYTTSEVAAGLHTGRVDGWMAPPPECISLPGGKLQCAAEPRLEERQDRPRMAARWGRQDRKANRHMKPSSLCSRGATPAGPQRRGGAARVGRPVPCRVAQLRYTHQRGGTDRDRRLSPRPATGKPWRGSRSDRTAGAPERARCAALAPRG